MFFFLLHTEGVRGKHLLNVYFRIGLCAAREKNRFTGWLVLGKHPLNGNSVGARWSTQPWHTFGAVMVGCHFT